MFGVVYTPERLSVKQRRDEGGGSIGGRLN